MTQQLTPWFPVSVKPARDGVYQVMALGGRFFMYSAYSDGVWLGTSRFIDGADEFGRRFGQTSMSLTQWRGLANHPKDPS